MWASSYIQKGCEEKVAGECWECFLPVGKTDVADCSLIPITEKLAMGEPGRAKDLCIFSYLVSISHETQVDGG